MSCSCLTCAMLGMGIGQTVWGRAHTGTAQWRATLDVGIRPFKGQAAAPAVPPPPRILQANCAAAVGGGGGRMHFPSVFFWGVGAKYSRMLVGLRLPTDPWAEDIEGLFRPLNSHSSLLAVHVVVHLHCLRPLDVTHQHIAIWRGEGGGARRSLKEKSVCYIVSQKSPRVPHVFDHWFLALHAFTHGFPTGQQLFPSPTCVQSFNHLLLPPHMFHDCIPTLPDTLHNSR